MQPLPKSKTASLSLPILLALVIGNMIGSGIFLLPATLANYGTISIFSWIITSAGAIFLALTFASLNRKYPRSGGPYVYGEEAYGRFVGFLVAYTYWISVCISNAAIAVASVSYMGMIWPAFDEHASHYNPMIALSTKIGVVWLFTLINIHGVRTAGILQIFLTIIKITPLLLISAVGLFYINPEYLMEFNVSKQSNLAALTGAATLTFWAFIGLETATVPAEETKGPRDITRATLYGTLIASAIYILCTLVIMGLIPALQLKNSQFPFAEAASLLFGSKTAIFVAGCAVISALGALNVNILIQGQVPMAAAHDNLFPSFFGKKSRHQTPARALIISSCLVTLLIFLTIDASLIKQFTVITLFASLATLTAYFISAMSELMLIFKNKKEKERFSRYEFIKSSFIALLAGIYAFWMVIGTGTETVFYGTLLLLTSFPAYILLMNFSRHPR